ncbi:MAG TPA: hypothetical protein VFN08_19480 [Gemmatimonadales bacterium]|jgi:hypothetical protein|nr:hypothetical protein [Gemmatimonadales bacterium]
MSADSSTTVAPVEESRVHRTSLVRGLAVVALWLATWPLRPSGAELRLGLDVALALAGWWAMLPGRRAGGKLFGEHGHWSSLVVALPIGFAIAAAAELWHMVRGGG